MDYQSKLLDKQYLETRLRDISFIRKKEFYFIIQESDRILSKTIYIEFWQNQGDKHIKLRTIRISDHEQENCPHIQFIIKPYQFLTKQKKQQFIKTVENSLKSLKKKMLFRKLNQIGESL